jgi:hypothetical protein
MSGRIAGAWIIPKDAGERREDRMQKARKVFIGLALGATLLAATVSAANAQNVQVNQPDVNLGTRDNGTTQSETNHAVFGSTIAAGWNDTQQFAITGLAGLTSITGSGYSTNGGASFTDAGLLPPPAPGFISLGDPALATNRVGTFYFATLAANPMTGDQRVVVVPSTSTSPTVVFGSPVMLDNVVASFIADKEFIAVDTTGGSFDGRVYVAWTEFASSFDSTPKVVFAHSTATTPLAFAAPIALSPTDALNHGAMPAVGPGGEVYVVWGRFVLSGSTVTSEDIRLMKSTDGGVSFANPDPMDPGPAKVIATPTPAPDNFGSGANPIRSRGFPRIAVDRTPFGSPTRGNVYVVYQADPDGAGPDRSNVFFTRSTDGGQSWSRPRSINTPPAAVIGADGTTNDNWMPSIAVSPSNGQVTVSFYDRREDPANTNIKLYRAVSTDAGMTWFDEPVSTAAFQPNTTYDPITNTGYMGDYNDAAADATNFYMSWGDLRNTCAPPPGATSPCSPVGRSDQDVFFAARPLVSGPDLAIRPWGNVTGTGPEWQSPDIFVVDAGGSEINAAKGQVNRLRARVRNLGNAVANGAVVHFKYAPWFAGIPDSAFKDIGTTVLDFAAAGDLAGNDLKMAPVAWDLTDLSDTNGGAWPMPVSAFQHFCVKVSIEFPTDANMSNNAAQTNFFDVPTITTMSVVQFMVGNPFESESTARLILTSLPEGYRAELKGLDSKFGEPFTLKPREIRVVTVEFTPPPESAKRLPAADTVAEIGLRIGRSDVGGISFRLRRGGEQRRDGQGALNEYRQTYETDYDRVFDAILAVLKERKEPVSLADRTRGLINTASIPVENEELRQLVPEALLKRVGKQDGRYLLSFHVVKFEDKAIEVGATALFIARGPEDSPIGGLALASNGRLEKLHLQLIAQRL